MDGNGNNQSDSRLERVHRAGERAQHALGKTWPYVVVGLIIGGSLLTIQEYLHFVAVPELVQKLIEHLGVGFLVSAIAVFFYEWGSHAKEMRAATERLLDWEHGLPRENLGKSIRKLFGEEDDKPLPVQAASLSLHCSNLVLHIASLLEQRESWANSEYVDFLSNFVSKYVVSNSEAFTSLSTLKGERRIVMPPTATQSTSDLLERYMRTLAASDSYKVIANMTAWRNNQLSDFQKVTANAIAKGVTVQRIFNFTHDYGVKLELEEVLKVLKQHMEEAEKSDRYQVRTLGPHELNASTSVLLDKRIREAHFAVITHLDQRGRALNVRLQFEGHDLSDILITQDELIVSNDATLFLEAWGAAIELNRTNWNGIITRVAQQLNQVLPAGSLLEAPPTPQTDLEKKQ